jgi:hypothetical protein
MTSINNLTQFTPGTKALSSEINDNFETLRTHHNNHETRLSTLETDFGNMETDSGEDLVNIEKAGAACDDITDDTAIIQSILDSGKSPFIPANKNVKITNTLVMKASGQRIVGGNSYTSVLRWYGLANGTMINASYSNARIENIRLDGLNVTGVNGILLAKDRSTYNQVLRNVRVWACKGVGIQGYDSDTSPQYYANDAYFEKCQVSYCATGMAFRVPTQHLNACMFDNCSTGLAAYVNSKINLSGGVFSTNEYDVKYNSAQITCFGTWFENGTQKIFSTFSGTSSALSLLAMFGCHIHTNTTQSYVIDLSEVTTSGSFVFVGNNFASNASTKDIYLSNNVNNFVQHNNNIGSVKGLNDVVKNDYKTRIMAAPYTPAVGLSSVFGASVYVTKPDGFTTFVPNQIKISIGGTVASETITVRIEVGFFDYGATKIVDKTFTATGDTWLTAADLAGLVKDATYIRNMKFQARTSAASTAATVTITPYMNAI